MVNKKFLREEDLYKTQIVEIMKEYNLMLDEDCDMVGDYLFGVNKTATAK